MARKNVYYYINDRFVNDNKTVRGYNVMLFGGDYDEDYWFDEELFPTLTEAAIFIDAYPANMIGKAIQNPVANRDYTKKELNRLKLNAT